MSISVINTGIVGASCNSEILYNLFLFKNNKYILVYHLVPTKLEIIIYVFYRNSVVSIVNIIHGTFFLVLDRNVSTLDNVRSLGFLCMIQ